MSLQRLTLKVLHVWCCYGSRDKRIGGLDWHHGFGQHEPQPCHFATVTNIHPGRLCNMFPSGKGPHYQRTEQVIDEGGCETIWLDSTSVCGSPWVFAFGVARSGVRFDPELRPTIGRSGYHSRWLGIGVLFKIDSSPCFSRLALSYADRDEAQHIQETG